MALAHHVDHGMGFEAAVSEFEIGFVDKYEDVRGHGTNKGAQFVGSTTVPVGVVRITNVDENGVFINGRFHGIKIVHKIVGQGNGPHLAPSAFEGAGELQVAWCYRDHVFCRARRRQAPS